MSEAIHMCTEMMVPPTVINAANKSAYEGGWKTELSETDKAFIAGIYPFD